ncbi:MAG: FAD-dependent oxidoreductase [Anaerolineae bacterium]|nr:FAD-dependent oxidoreductase [Anaerolineae bacterium]
MNTQFIHTIIIGGGQAGLITSYWLTQHGREHLVLEKADRPASAWSQRWDSFTLVTPNWAFLPSGAEYAGDSPDGFMPRDEIVATFDRYTATHGLPLRCGVTVTAVCPLENRPGYRVETQDGEMEALNVVVATGLFQRPKIPAFAASLPAGVLQLHSEQYRNPLPLPPGAVLVVGSGQSGCQIAEELYQSGRRVYMSIGSTGRGPRTYRGKDIFRWLKIIGYLDRTPDKLPSPRARFSGNPHVSGARGGHDLNLHQFARAGVTLLGHVQGSFDGTLSFAPDHKDSLTKSDAFAAMLLDAIDGYVAKTGLDAPGERPPVLRDGYDADAVTELDLARAGVTTLIWAAGYDFDFDLVKLPVTDEYGFPLQQRGVTAYPGLYFVGLPWLHTQQSGLLMGVSDDAALIASQIVNG